MFVYLRRIELIFFSFKEAGDVVATQKIANVDEQWIERDNFYVVFMTQTILAAHRRKTVHLPFREGACDSCSEALQVEYERYQCYEQSCRSGEAERTFPRK